MTHIMIDLETWGTTPGSDLRSIGAVVFDPTTGHIAEGAGRFHIATDNPTAMYVKDQYGLDTSNSDPDIKRYPLTRDSKTVAWWNDQSDEAQSAFVKPVDLRDALISFGEWLRVMEHGDSHILSPSATTRIWAHGPSFDVSILEAAYRAVDLPTPWHYRAPRDTRTIMEAAGMDPHKGLEPFNTGTHHNALDDAICQAKAVCEAYSRIAWSKRLDWDGQAQHDQTITDQLTEAEHGWLMYGPDGNWHWSANKDLHECIEDQRPATSM